LAKFAYIILRRAASILKKNSHATSKYPPKWILINYINKKNKIFEVQNCI